MALFFADLVRVACHATGAGSLLLGAPLPGHRGFDLVPPGMRFHYAVLGVTHPEEWETGEGELSGGALARTPFASSAGGAPVAFSPGLKTVALTVSAAWFADQAAVLGAKADLSGAAFTGPVSATELSLGNDLAVSHGGTGASSAAAARTNLGLGSMATQASNAVAITGGSMSGLNSLSVIGNADVGGAYRVDGVKVVGNRTTGWSAATGPASRASFDTATVTTAQLAQRLKALIDDLISHGLIRTDLMLGAALAARPLARNGLGLLTSDFGRTRLAEAPMPAWGRTDALMRKEGAARAAQAGAAAATRP